MLVPLSVLYRLAEQLAHPAWMTPAAAAKLGSLATSLPDIAATVGFEIRLAANEDQVDFGVSLSRSPELQGAWRAFDDEQERAGNSTISWLGFGRFLEQWCADESELHPWIAFIFLEMDAIQGALVPSIFTTFDWPLEQTHNEVEERLRSWSVARSALDLIEPDWHRGSIDRAVRNAFVQLPTGGRVIHAGSMIGRAAENVRLSVAIPADSFPRYLERLGLNGAWYEQAMRQACPPLPTVHFEHDIAETPGAKIGIVISGKEAVRRTLGDQSGRLEIDREKAAAVLAWPTSRTVGDGTEEVTAELRSWISHLKVNFTPSAPPEIKAYLEAAFLVKDSNG